MMPLRGAGMSGKSNLLNSPGLSGMAKIMLCSFHCSRSSMFSSCAHTHVGKQTNRVGLRSRSRRLGPFD